MSLGDGSVLRIRREVEQQKVSRARVAVEPERVLLESRRGRRVAPSGVAVTAPSLLVAGPQGPSLACLGCARAVGGGCPERAALPGGPRPRAGLWSLAPSARVSWGFGAVGMSLSVPFGGASALRSFVFLGLSGTSRVGPSLGPGWPLG